MKQNFVKLGPVQYLNQFVEWLRTQSKRQNQLHVSKLTDFKKSRKFVKLKGKAPIKCIINKLEKENCLLDYWVKWRWFHVVWRGSHVSGLRKATNVRLRLEGNRPTDEMIVEVEIRKLFRRLLVRYKDFLAHMS